jgi:hypothetical protein
MRLLADLPLNLDTAVRDALAFYFESASQLRGHLPDWKAIADSYKEAVAIQMERGGEPMVTAAQQQVCAFCLCSWLPVLLLHLCLALFFFAFPSETRPKCRVTPR